MNGSTGETGPLNSGSMKDGTGDSCVIRVRFSGI